MLGRSVLMLLAGLTLASMAQPAAADLKLCNKTSSRVGVALGYKDLQGWASEGWWNINPQGVGQDGKPNLDQNGNPKPTCETLLKGNLIARYYYIYAVDYDKGGSWGGNAYMCTRNKLFTIRNAAGRLKDCEARSYKKTGFFEVDTGEEADWTVELSGPKTTAPPQ